MSEALTPDVVCIGEALVDFLPETPGAHVSDVEKWVRCSGGSPANVAVGISRLGGRAAFLGVVGKDEFGDFLVKSLAKEGVDVRFVRQTDEGKTGLVFISLDDKGDRSFSFYRTRAAEYFLADRDVNLELLASARAIHCGTNSLLFRDAQKAMLRMVSHGRRAGRIVCCDPNLRLHLWSDPRELRDLLDNLIPSCSVVKLAEDEVPFVTGQPDPEKALHVLAKKGVLLPVVTLGDKGAALWWQGRTVRVPAPSAKVVDTTGAGDGFTAALLFGLTRLYPDHATFKMAGVGELRELCAFACAVASKVVEQLGAVRGLPRRAEVEARMPALLRGM